MFPSGVRDDPHCTIFTHARWKWNKAGIGKDAGPTALQVSYHQGEHGDFLT